MYAIKHNNTIYIRQAETELQKSRNDNMSLIEKKFSHGGNRFEGYICTFIEPEINDSSILGHQFCCVFKSRLNAHSLIISAEIDCVKNRNETKQSLENMNFYEVKTCSHYCSFEKVARTKMIKWWAQCSLVGVEKIVCGYRNKHLIVDNIHEYSLGYILNKGKRYWSSDVCFNFLDKFLTFLKDCLSEENVLYSFYCTPKCEIRCRKEKTTKCEILPEWYKNSFAIM